MSFNYRKLLGRIVEKYGTQFNFSIAMGVSERTLSLKVNGKVPWKDVEMKRAMELLEIPELEVYYYFFETKVQTIEHSGTTKQTA